MPVRGFWQNRTIREMPPLPVLRRGENIPRRFLTRDRVLPHWVETLEDGELGAWTGEEARSRERLYREWRDHYNRRDRLRDEGVWTAREEEHYRRRFGYYDRRGSNPVFVDEIVEGERFPPITWSRTASWRSDFFNVTTAYNELVDTTRATWSRGVFIEPMRPDISISAISSRSYRMPNSVYYDRTRSFIRGIVIVPGRLTGKDTDEACYFFVNMHCALPPKDTARVLSRYFDTDEKVRKLVHKPYVKGVADPIFHPGVHANMDEAIRYWKHFDNHETVTGSFMNLSNLTNALSSTYDRNSFLWQDGKWKVYLVHSSLKWRPIDPHNPDDCFK